MEGLDLSTKKIISILLLQQRILLLNLIKRRQYQIKKNVRTVLFMLLLLLPEFHVAVEEAAADSHQADKTVFGKENSLSHHQKILDKFLVVPGCWKPC